MHISLCLINSDIITTVVVTTMAATIIVVKIIYSFIDNQDRQLYRDIEILEMNSQTHP